MRSAQAVFVFNLLQDVNILRGLVYLARQETEASICFLVTKGFVKRDSRVIWQKELAAMVRDTGAEIHLISESADVWTALQGGGGILISASESDLPEHRETSAIMRATPSSFLKVTLQHGLECVGFRQSREHNIRHGRDVGFNADVVCSWLAPHRLSATRASERAKIIVTGPPTLLQRRRTHPDHPPLTQALVCENMHSARLQATGDHKASFMETFFDFCRRQPTGEGVTLRPHPGGQYVLKNNIALPENVALNNLPIYDVNLPGYGYGISAPSTVVFDMVLAGLPVGVWRDPDGIMDIGNYAGLAQISAVDDWLNFAQECCHNHAALVARQNAFLERQGVLMDPNEIYRRFTALLRNALAQFRPAAQVPAPAPTPAVPAKAGSLPPAAPQRILFIANDTIATLQLSFLKPLQPWFDQGKMQYDIITEAEMTQHFGAKRFSKTAGDWLDQRIKAFAPDLILCCRYSGPHANRILMAGKKRKIPVVYHIDDDLLNVPRELGESKWRMHNSRERLQCVRQLLDQATMVYASTPGMYRRLKTLGTRSPIFCGGIYCAARVLRPATMGGVQRVGYMGTSSHMHDLQFVLPALEVYLDRNPRVIFELFGLSPVPEVLARFGDRVQIVPSVNNYGEFLKTLADRKWDIGLCPLAHTPFNAVKANTKWVEYTACGMATVATRGLVYDDCAAEGRGLLVHSEEWADGLQMLTDNPEIRYRMTVDAQTHLMLNYSENKLQQQVFNALGQAQKIHAEVAGKQASTPAVAFDDAGRILSA